MAKWLAALLLASGVVLLPSRASGCDCIYRPLHERYRLADQVFLGEVLEAKKPGENPSTSTFRVKAQWKGVTTSEVSLRNPLDMCGARFEESIGETYLVFASRGETTSCAGTRHLAQSEAALDLLGPAFGGAQLVRATWGAFALALILMAAAAASFLLRPRRLVVTILGTLAALVSLLFGFSRVGLEQHLEDAELQHLREIDAYCEGAMQARPGQGCVDSPVHLPDFVQNGFYWASSGPFVATVSSQLCVVDVRDGSGRCSRVRSSPGLDNLALKSDGTKVVTAGRGNPTAWILEKGEFVPRPLAMPVEGSKLSEGAQCITLGFGEPGEIVSVAWANSEASHEATEQDTWGLQRWDVTSGRLLGEWTRPGALAAAALAPDGGLVATATNSSTGSRLSVHDTRTGEELASVPRDWFAVRPALAFAGPSTIVYEERSRRLALFQLAGSRLQRVWEHATQCPIRTVAAARGGIVLTAEGARLLDGATGTLKQELGGGVVFGEPTNDAWLIRTEEGQTVLRRCGW